MHYVLVLFFNDTATTEIYTLSLHDALPIFPRHDRAALLELGEADLGEPGAGPRAHEAQVVRDLGQGDGDDLQRRSEEHTSELQSRQYLVCRLLLEKNNNTLPSAPLTARLQL